MIHWKCSKRTMTSFWHCDIVQKCSIVWGRCYWIPRLTCQHNLILTCNTLTGSNLLYFNSNEIWLEALGNVDNFFFFFSLFHYISTYVFFINCLPLSLLYQSVTKLSAWIWFFGLMKRNIPEKFKTYYGKATVLHVPAHCLMKTYLHNIVLDTYKFHTEWPSSDTCLS